LGRQSLIELGEVACHAYVELKLRALDVERFAAALRSAIARHPMLRAVIEPSGTQRILKDVPPFEIAVTDASALPIVQAEACARGLREEMAHKVLDVQRWPLFEVKVTRVANEDWRLHVGIDALILDGESMALLLSEVFALYEGQSVYEGQSLPAPQSVLSFR